MVRWWPSIHTGKSLRVIDALTGPRLRHFRREDREPRRTGWGLLFELAEEGRVDIGSGENADGRSRQSVLVGREYGIETRVITWHLVHTLCAYKKGKHEWEKETTLLPSRKSHYLFFFKPLRESFKKEKKKKSYRCHLQRPYFYSIGTFQAPF